MRRLMQPEHNQSSRTLETRIVSNPRNPNQLRPARRPSMWLYREDIGWYFGCACDFCLAAIGLVFQRGKVRTKDGRRWNPPPPAPEAAE